MKIYLSLIQKMFVAMLIVCLFSSTFGISAVRNVKAKSAALQTTSIVQITDISMAEPIVVGDQIFFRHEDETYGDELWKTDGTEAGTDIVRDITLGAGPGGNTIPEPYFAFNNLLIFGTAYTQQLWRSDGTEAGTYALSPAPAPHTYNPPYGAVDAGDKIFFAIGNQIWKTDGTNPAELVKTLNPCSTSLRLAYSNGFLLVLNCNIGSNGIDIWKSDGTEAGTEVIASVAGVNMLIDGVSDMVDVNGTLFFTTALYFGDEIKLWKSDGTEVGTGVVKDFTAMGVVPVGLNSLNGTLLFWTDISGDQGQLWKSDGTEAGTVVIKNVGITTGIYDFFEHTIIFHDQLFFASSDGILWKTDGTSAGTISLGQEVSGFVVVDETLYFDLWGSTLGQTDGTVAGTVILTTNLGGAISLYESKMIGFQGRLLVAFSKLWEVVTGDAPTVLQVTDGKNIIKNKAVIKGPITKLVIKFSQDVTNPLGDGDSIDVTNPNSYRIHQATALWPISSIQYSNNAGAGPFAATINLGKPLTSNFSVRILGQAITGSTGLHLAGNGVSANTDFNMLAYVPVTHLLHAVVTDGTSSIIESSESSGKGGQYIWSKSIGTYLMVGDYIGDRQIRSIFHVENNEYQKKSPLSLTFRFKPVAIKGANPFNTLGMTILVDIGKPVFGTTSNIDLSDFQAPGRYTVPVTFVKEAGGWYSGKITNTAILKYAFSFSAVEYRFRFSKDDNDNNKADYLTIKTTDLQLLAELVYK